MSQQRHTLGALFFQPVHPGADFLGGIAIAVTMRRLAVVHAMTAVDAETQIDGERVVAFCLSWL